MDLKNTALKFWHTEEEESGYGGPCLVKSEHMDILVRTPRQFSDVREYADALMSGCTLMVSFEAVDCVMRNRIFDYLNGVSYIIGARVSKCKTICFCMLLLPWKLTKKQAKNPPVPGLADKF